jgi:haloalkane dehalogenase
MSLLSQGIESVAAARVRWRKVGQGPSVVFLPGFPLAGETWDGVTARLADRFTCITFDLIGLGKSSSPLDDHHSSPGQARVFKGALEQLGVGPYVLVGNDTGGWIARELALIDPERVRKLVLTNTEIPGHRPPWIPLYQTFAHWPGASAMFALALRSRAYRRSPLAFGGVFFDRDRLDGDFHQRYVAPLIDDPERIAGALRFLRCMKFRRLDEFAGLHGVLRMPVLFVWGADDPTFPIARGRAMAPQFPNVAGFHEVGRAKLFFYEEQPAVLADHIARFCA